MNTNSPKQEPTLNTQITGGTIVAIIAIVFGFAWIAFAYYKGTSDKAVASAALLLHEIVPILLIIILVCIRPHIEITRAVDLLILMIAIWIFKRRLAILMPFIFGFGLAYFFRFLLIALQNIPLPKGRRLQLSRGYAQGLLSVIILGAFALLFFYVIPQIRGQAVEMSNKLVVFFDQQIVPLAVGEKLTAITVAPENPEIMYLGTEHGIYRCALSLDEITNTTDNWTDNTGQDLIRHQTNITGEKPNRRAIHAIATATTPAGGKTHQIYIGTSDGLYTLTVEPESEEEAPPIWHKVNTEPFTIKPVQAIAIPPWDTFQIYVATDTKLYHRRRDDSGLKWVEIQSIEIHPDLPAESPIHHIVSSSSGSRRTYVASKRAVYWHYDDVGEASQPRNVGETPQPRDVGEASQPRFLGWEKFSLSSALKDLSIQAMVLATLDEKEHLYVNTLKGIYQLKAKEWIHQKNAPTQSAEPLSLLYAISGKLLYAGNSDVLYYTTDLQEKESWRIASTARAPAFSQLKALPIVGDTDITASMETYLREKLPILAEEGSQIVGTIVGTLVSSFSSIALGFGDFLLATFLTVMVFSYTNQSLRTYILYFINLFPKSNRENVKRYLKEIDQNLQAFLKGQVTVIAIISIISIIVYAIIGVPFPIIVGILAGLCNAIPTFGPFIGGVFAMASLLMGFAAGDFGDFNMLSFFVRVAAVIGAIIAIQTVDNALISPKVMSSAVDVDPLLIMFGVIAGATVLGFWGVLLAIPIIVIVKSVITVSREIQA